MEEEAKGIVKKIAFFKRKYYKNYLVRGSILVPAILLGYFLSVSLIEYFFWLSRTSRFFVLAVFISALIFLIIHFFKKPLTWWWYGKGLNEEESAKIIGAHFPTIGDKLLNVIQLSSKDKGTLAEASVAQKSKQLENISFEQAVDLKANKKYLRYLITPTVLIVALAFINSGIFTKSTKRIVNFNQEFSPEAPFLFSVTNKNLVAFFNEDFNLNVKMSGNSLPQSAYLISGTQKLKLENLADGNFQYLFEKLQQPLRFQIEAAGFFSAPYEITLANRPGLTELKIESEFPFYTGKPKAIITNDGNIAVPEGTKIKWDVKAEHTESAVIAFISAQEQIIMKQVDNQLFEYNRTFKTNEQYSIHLKNETGYGKEKISFSIDIIKDQHPQIIVESLQDSVLYKSILLGGEIKDDYGISNLNLIYQINSNPTSSIKIPVTTAAAQRYFYSWSIDSLHLKPGDRLNYYFEVWDNDGVNGRKSTRSASYSFSLPTEAQLKTTVAEQQNLTQNKIDNGVEKAKELKRSINEAEQKLRSKNNLDWQDKKLLNDLVEQKKKLDQNIKDFQQENRLLERQKETFSQENEKIKEKSEQIQKLMDQLLDEETKALFNELEKLLKENVDSQKIQRLLEKMNQKQINLEQELERALELFKQLQYEYKLEQAISEMSKQQEKQEQLLNNTEKSSEKDNNSKDNEGSKSNKDLAEDQQKLQDELKKFEKSLEELNKLGDEIGEEQPKPEKEDLEQLENNEQQSKESLEQNMPSKSIQHQKNAVSKMKDIQKGLKQMQSSMQMEIDTQNLESLRQIVHGLIKLSFDQENLMKDFNTVQQSDPKYIQVSEGQVNLKNDSKVLADSLLQLSKKDPFLSNIATREINELNSHLNKALEHIKDRKKSNASAEMQRSMTNINNLALMLNDHFENMMNAMANAMPGKGKGSKQNGKKLPNLGKMQQEINRQIEKLKAGQKAGRLYSEDLAKLAAEQERIRNALKEMQEKLKREGGKEIGGDLPGKMEQTEMDLVNKQITEQTIRRQNEILTRLLEAEKSMREQDLDQERKGQTAKDYQKDIPPSFEQYLRLKEKEVELLKSLPPKLFPYYKKEVNEYFKRIN
ncbi:MAG: DUF4175 family protein [Bacteroidetes bacterium]|nr:DUF4175 family protein [Bacteroidota bacterium]